MCVLCWSELYRKCVPRTTDLDLQSVFDTLTVAPRARSCAACPSECASAFFKWGGSVVEAGPPRVKLSLSFPVSLLSCLLLIGVRSDVIIPSGARYGQGSEKVIYSQAGSKVESFRLHHRRILKLRCHFAGLYKLSNQNPESFYIAWFLSDFCTT